MVAVLERGASTFADAPRDADLVLDRVLVNGILAGDGDAWAGLLARYERPLLAFAEKRLGRGGAAEDIVQETFIGFLKSVESFDGQRSLMSYLFSICAHKVADHRRREGRRPAMSLSAAGGAIDPASRDLDAPAIVEAAEEREMQEQIVAESLGRQVDRWRRRGDETKLRCAEMLFVDGAANKHVAAECGISEQKVANFKYEFIARTRKMLSK